MALVVGALIATANTAKEEVGDLCSGQKWAWAMGREVGQERERGWLARHVVVYRNVQFVFIQRKMKLSSSYSIIL